MFGRLFRTRHPDRDREADRSRWAGVIDAVDGALASARREHDGLARRHGDVQSNAAFLGDGDGQAPTVIDDMERDLIAAETRLRALKQQIALLEQLATTAARLSSEADGVKAAAGPSGD